MGWIFMTIFFCLLGMVAIGAYFYGRAYHTQYQAAVADGRRRSNEEVPVRGIALTSFIVLAALYVIITGLMMVKTVEQRQVGIVKNVTGTIADEPKNSGWVVIAPWQSMSTENIGIQHHEWEFGDENAAVSADQQKVRAKLAVNYQIDPARVVDLYKRVGPSWKSIIIDARVPQAFKETTATFQTPELTAKREDLRQRTKERLTRELAPYDINVVDVFIPNLGFSQTYTESIEAKQKQVQDALRAQAKVAEVEAQARQKVAAANGEAAANVARARGDATANRLRQRSLTPLLVQLEAIQKLNPNVQTIICPPGSVCIPNSTVVPAPTTP